MLQPLLPCLPLQAALVVYAIVFGVKSHSFGAPAAVPLALGILDILLGLVIVTCGYKRLFFLR